MSTQHAVTNQSTPASSTLRWGWIVAGAFLLELALTIVFVPLLILTGLPKLAPFVPIGTFGLGFLTSWWVMRKIPGRRVLHGTLIGVLATLIYVGLCMIQPEGISPVIAGYGPFLFVFANGLRVVGTVAGSFAYRPRGLRLV
jgi:hypothetical protein